MFFPNEPHLKLQEISNSLMKLIMEVLNREDEIKIISMGIVMP